MAVGNYALVVDTSNFKPFTFREMIEPYLLYKLDFERMEEKLENQTKDFDSFVLPEEASDEYRQQLADYRLSIKDASEKFYTQGLGSARRDLMNAFRVGKTEIAPMYELYKQYLKAKEKAESLGPDAILGKGPDINDYLRGETSPIKYQSRKQIISDVSALVQLAVNQAKGDPVFEAIGQKEYLKLQMRYPGADPQEIQKHATLQALENYDGNNQALLQTKKSLRNYLNSMDLKGWSLEGLDKLNSAVNTGMMAGIPDLTKIEHDPTLSYKHTLQSMTHAANAEKRALENYAWLQYVKEQTYTKDADGNLVYRNTLLGQEAKRKAENAGHKPSYVYSWSGNPVGSTKTIKNFDRGAMDNLISIEAAIDHINERLRNLDKNSNNYTSRKKDLENLKKDILARQQAGDDRVSIEYDSKGDNAIKDVYTINSRNPNIITIQPEAAPQNNTSIFEIDLKSLPNG